MNNLNPIFQQILGKNQIRPTGSEPSQTNPSSHLSHSRMTMLDNLSREEQMTIFGRVAAKWCNNRYDIDESNYYAISKAIDYITRHKPMPQGLKGLLLFGDRGTGKTVIMKAINALLPDEEKFTFVNVPQISGYYSQKGDEVFERFSRGFDSNYIMNQPRKKNHICLNDIGRERIENQWMGNKEDVGSMLIYIRYDLFQDFRVITHATSNFQTMDEWVERYGDLNADRIREMFYFIELNGKSRR